MNIGLVTAGGTEKRTQQMIPKQFINIYGKPMLMRYVKNRETPYQACLITNKYSKTDGLTTTEYIPREILYRVQTTQAYI
jgi:2-C-methyl-D-erythritol 4-phosphate cytidylyltransferase